MEVADVKRRKHLLLLVSLLCTACSKPVPTILFVLSNKDQGVFFIREDPLNGAPVRRVENKIEIRVTKGGIVDLQETEFLYSWHRMAVLWEADGTVRLQTSEEQCKDDTWGCWELASVPGGVYYYAGTYKNKTALDKIERPSELKGYLLAPRNN
jgi:hypothetical protein